MLHSALSHGGLQAKAKPKPRCKPCRSNPVAIDLDQASVFAVRIVLMGTNRWIRRFGLGAKTLVRECTMQDLTQYLLKLRADAEDCDLISKQAVDEKKHAIFATLADHLRRAAVDVENAIAEKAGNPKK